LAKTRTQFVCQACGTVHTRWAGKCDGCGEWNTIVEDDPSGGVGGGPGKPPPARGAPSRSPVSRARSRTRRASTGERTRPGDRRRLRARIGAAGRRRSGHRQVDAADAGRRGSRAAGPPGHLRLRRRGRRPGAAARATPRRRRHRRAARRRDQCRGHPRDTGRRQAPDLVIIDSDPDLVERSGGIRAGHRHPGARRRRR
jgi:hypothetical protein